MSTTGEIIKLLREQRGLTQQQLANILGLKTYTTITKWESGDNFPKGKDIKRLSEFFKVSSDYILGLEKSNSCMLKTSDYPFYPISISAGQPIEVNTITEDNVETITLPDDMMRKWAGSEDIYIMRVNGESMNKVIPHNSLIVVKNIELSELNNGDIVIYSNGNEYSVKRFYNDKVNSRVIFRPDSTDPSFTDYLVSYGNISEIKIHGKVVVYVVDSD
ncbi:XRE family transcriptional regulator [Paenibacillus larvae]|uniref:LexA family protein n=1 Tax=Paenibacillus larvae TaxID=1464 RepID=UPI0034905804